MELLPDELFENVCRHLPPRDIKSMMLVDNYSRTIIESSPVLMDKLPLYVSDMNDEFSDEDEVDGRELLPYLGIFQKFGHSIRSLDIVNYAFETIDQLRFVLRLLPKLETLTVKNVTFQRRENKFLNSIVQVPSITLYELRNIICVNSDPKIFSLFTINHNNIRVRRLSLSDSSAFCYGGFVETLGQQTKLKQLTVQGITDNCDIFSYGHLVISQLDALEIENCFVGDRDQMKCLVEMIKNQRRLKLLKIVNTPIQISTDIMWTYRQILAPNISELHLDIRVLLVFGWKDIFSNLRTIEKLIVKRDYGNVSNEIIDLIIKNLTLTHLELGIGVVSEKILQNIISTNYCNRLKVLKIAKIDFDKMKGNFDFSQTNTLMAMMAIQ